MQVAPAEENQRDVRQGAKTGGPSDEEEGPSLADETRADLLEIMSMLKEEIAELRAGRKERNSKKRKTSSSCNNKTEQTGQPIQMDDIFGCASACVEVAIVEGSNNECHLVDSSKDKD